MLVSSVIWAVKNRFSNNFDKYIKYCSLFESHFFYTDKNFCDSTLNPRKQIKKKLLWACQLLKLVGRRNAFNCPTALFSE